MGSPPTWVVGGYVAATVANQPSIPNLGEEKKEFKQLGDDCLYNLVW